MQPRSDTASQTATPPTASWGSLSLVPASCTGQSGSIFSPGGRSQCLSFSLNPSVHLLTLSYSFTWREEITIGPNGEVSKNFVRVYHGSAASSADHLDFDGSSSEGEDKGSSTKDVELDYSPDRSAVVLDSIETENRLHAGGDAAAARRR
jgi:hypothetical protein